jgi:uncharacterized protein (TIGR04255 family)
MRELSVATAEPAHYERNLIRQVVCEFRFPTLFELDSPKPPAAFAGVLRKAYPVYRMAKNIDLGNASVEQTYLHTWSSLDGLWTVGLRCETISLETTNYHSFGDLMTRLNVILGAAGKTIDSEFFTRVGLRYINAAPFGEEPIDKWVNPVLVGALTGDIFGAPENYWQRIAGKTKIGMYVFQHGIGVNTTTHQNEYSLDFDFAADNVSLTDAPATIKKLHDDAFSLFTWSLGEKAREYLGPSVLEQGKP